MGGKRGQVHRPGLGTGRISQMPPQENVRGPKANVRISNTKEDEAKGDLGLGTGRISRMPPQEKVRGSQANVRISNTKEDEAKGPKSQRKMSRSQMYVCMYVCMYVSMH